MEALLRHFKVRLNTSVANANCARDGKAGMVVDVVFRFEGAADLDVDWPLRGAFEGAILALVATDFPLESFTISDPTGSGCVGIESKPRSCLRLEMVEASHDVEIVPRRASASR